LPLGGAPYKLPPKVSPLKFLKF